MSAPATQLPISPHAAKEQKSWNLTADITLDAVVTHGNSVELSLTHKCRRLTSAYAPREMFRTGRFHVGRGEVRMSIDIERTSFEMPEAIGIEVCALTGIPAPEAKQS